MHNHLENPKEKLLTERNFSIIFFYHTDDSLEYKREAIKEREPNSLSIYVTRELFEVKIRAKIRGRQSYFSHSALLSKQYR